MIKGKWKLLISITFVACIVFMASNSLFAAINSNYYEEYVQNNQVFDFNLDKKVKSSTLLNAFGALIYAVGSIMEYILGKVFTLITGADIFPWADAILFNAIPFLDVNVFTPSDGSLVAAIQDFIAGTYYTVLMLASTFFGIAVMVSAIRLVLSAIAEDKAKYKKAIVDWLLGLVMLWGMHFFISFVLYLNEQLVYSASTMVTTMMEDPEVQNIAVIQYEVEDDIEEVETFIEAMESFHLGDVFSDPFGTIGEIIDSIEDFFGWGRDTYEEQLTESAKETLRANPRISRILLRDDRVAKYTFKDTTFSNYMVAGSDAWYSLKWGDEWVIRTYASYVNMVLMPYDDLVKMYNKSVTADSDIETIEFFEAIAETNKYIAGELQNTNVVYNLAKFFKESSWSTTDNSWKADKSVIQYAILYAILVAQSLIFFISYAKRLFYVVLLILMAPVVVVFDFFMRTSK